MIKKYSSHGGVWELEELRYCVWRTATSQLGRKSQKETRDTFMTSSLACLSL